MVLDQKEAEALVGKELVGAVVGKGRDCARGNNASTVLYTILYRPADSADRTEVLCRTDEIKGASVMLPNCPASISEATSTISASRLASEKLPVQ